jgi:hypothetical protein
MQTVNLILLTLHNLTRWLVLIFALLVLIRAFSGWFEKKTYQDQDRRFLMIYTSVFDLQILIGIILFFTKGWGGVMINGGSEVMSNSALRFFAVEHWVLMLLAVIVAHIGSSQAKKVGESLKKYRRTAIWIGLSIILVLAAIPWPGMAAGRPLFRLFGLDF